MYRNPVQVKVWGERACFTRPEMKAERVSYPVMTPSAARGVLEAIFWKPEFEWHVTSIAVLKPIRHFSAVRNEVNRRASPQSAGFDISETRTQRHTLGLRDVAYVISADVIVAPHVGEDAAKYRDQFRRRVNKGQCFNQPYLGCREFVGYFGNVDGSESAIDLSEPLGLVLLDIEYKAEPPHEPHFFQAELVRGVLNVPDYSFNTKGGADVPAKVGG
ncbi:MAG: type I-C CRISPR-associated protein Cas5c [Actinomycetota bacterium]|nr:type I-C CRISPR-associated protein Cas5c [Actinomycetota bacterium]